MFRIFNNDSHRDRITKYDKIISVFFGVFKKNALRLVSVEFNCPTSNQSMWYTNLHYFVCCKNEAWNFDDSHETKLNTEHSWWNIEELCHALESVRSDCNKLCISPNFCCLALGRFDSKNKSHVMQDANYVNNRKSNASNDIKHMWQRLRSDEMAIQTQDLLLFLYVCM